MPVTVYVSEQKAGKNTIILCREDGSVYWEQVYPMGGMCTPSRVEQFFIRPKKEKGEIVVVMIKGKPSVITGLDEGIFVSSRGKPKSERDVYVMSETAFKLFSPASSDTAY